MFILQGHFLCTIFMLVSQKSTNQSLLHSSNFKVTVLEWVIDWLITQIVKEVMQKVFPHLGWHYVYCMFLIDWWWDDQDDLWSNTRDMFHVQLYASTAQNLLSLLHVEDFLWCDHFPQVFVLIEQKLRKPVNLND